MTSFYAPVATCKIGDLASIYETIFGRTRDGTFVEVGAYDGESYSNTSCLADLGWSGLYVEPVPSYAKRCADRHSANPGIRTVNCAIGVGGGNVEIFVGGTLSTTSTAHVEMCAAISWAKWFHRGRSVSVPRVRLNELLAKSSIRADFDLLVIDVEGTEEEVLDTIDLNEYRPRAIIIEILDHHPDFESFPAIVSAGRRVRDRIHDSGYVEYLRDIMDTIYIRKE